MAPTQHETMPPQHDLYSAEMWRSEPRCAEDPWMYSYPCTVQQMLPGTGSLM